MDKLIIKKGTDLTDEEFSQLNESSFREFNVGLPSPKERVSKNTFFLIKRGSDLIAMGQLIPISPVIFDENKYSILGIGGIIADEKGKGYGKQIIQALTKYLLDNNQTGLGFCMPKNQGFYEKAGLNVDSASTKRFVYKKNGKVIRDEEGHYIIYKDSNDRLMEQILSKPNKEVSLPRAPDW